MVLFGEGVRLANVASRPTRSSRRYKFCRRGPGEQLEGTGLVKPEKPLMRAAGAISHG